MRPDLTKPATVKAESTLKRVLKAAGWTWKRLRQTIAARRDEDEFQVAQEALADSHTPPEEGQIEFWFVDETGFALPPSVPSAWQPVGETIAVPAQPSRRLKVLGLLTADNR